MSEAEALAEAGAAAMGVGFGGSGCAGSEPFVVFSVIGVAKGSV